MQCLSSLSHLGKICILDLETTDLLKNNGRIIEIGIICFNFYTEQRMDYSYRIDPGEGTYMSKEAEKTHGINLDSLKDCHALPALWNKICDIVDNSYIVGFNALLFDIPMLLQERSRYKLKRLFKYKACFDLAQIFWKNPRTLSMAHKYYTGNNAIDAHSALGDVKSCLNILCKLQEEHFIPNTQTDFSEWINSDANKGTFKNKIITPCQLSF